MSWEEAVQYLHKKSDEIKADPGLCLTAASASEIARARRQAVLKPG
jgi:hypothetical protein